MKKRLSYTACEDGHYVVMCGKTALGCIEKQGLVFKKRVVFQESVLNGAEWTGECLIELGEHMLSLENKVSRKPAHNKQSAPCKKAKDCRFFESVCNNGSVPHCYEA